MARLGSEPEADRSRPEASARGAQADVVPDSAPLYRPTPLNGRWVSAPLTVAEADAIGGAAGRRLTVQVGSTALLVSVGTSAEPRQRIIAYEAIFVDGHEVQLSPIGYPQQKATYAWAVVGDRLSFRLRTRSADATPSALLVTVPFDRDPIPPPPWVRYPSALEGRWPGTDAAGRVTLVIRNARLTLWRGDDRRARGEIEAVRAITVDRHRVHVRSQSGEGETATFRWQIRDGRLGFVLLDSGPDPALRLETATFRSSRPHRRRRSRR